ncbi:MAG: DUF262 domain-containing protein [Flavobacteriales bacterium]|nr:DUF262 domain-containing protein [Flavobacteriales bacterium]
MGATRQAKFVESILLGLPIPYIFAADTGDGRLEIVDGSQRLRTLVGFMDDKLTLGHLEVLDKPERFQVLQTLSFEAAQVQERNDSNDRSHGQER